MIKQLVDKHDKEKVDMQVESLLADNSKPEGSIDVKETKSLSNFKIQRVLGKGAFGTVSLGLLNGMKYAIKEIDKTSVINQLLEGDEERYYVMRDREITVSEMVSGTKY